MTRRTLVVLLVSVTLIAACGASTEGKQVSHVRAQTGPPPHPVRPVAAPPDLTIPVLHWLSGIFTYIADLSKRPEPQPVRHATVRGPAPRPGGGFLACVVQRESGGNPAAVNPSSGTGGLFQDMPGTWANAANEIDPSIVTRWPRAQFAPPNVQWQVNAHIFATQGARPWAGGRYRC